MPFSYTYTVFTPTYNRAHTLHRVYDSLVAQTFRDFEWVVVDDGSTDGTRELVEGWQREAAFPIRYFWQENRRKHVAFNRGVGEARGELFLCIDSDDAYLPDALERMKEHWDAIPEADRPRFSAVTGLSCDVDGNVCGEHFPEDVFDSDPLEIFYRYRVTGEKAGFHRTDVLREIPHSDADGGAMVADGFLWDRISLRYKTRFVNEVYRVYYTDQTGWGRGVAPERVATGAVIAYRETLNHHLFLFRHWPLQFCRAAAQYVRFSLHAGIRPGEQAASIRAFPGKSLWAVAFPVGLAVYLRDRAKSARGAV